MVLPSIEKTNQIPLWLKILATCFLCVFVPVYWIKRGPANFLWFCDIALIVVTVALWMESRFLVSMMAVSILLPELVWSIDYFGRLLTGSHLFGLGATSYMFNEKIPGVIRVLSFIFHIYLPIILLWTLYRLRFHEKSWIAQTVLAWMVLPLCYWFTGPVENINWVFGPGPTPQQWLPAPLYLVLLMVLLPLFIYLPSHYLFKRLFSEHKVPGT